MEQFVKHFVAVQRGFHFDELLGQIALESFHIGRCVLAGVLVAMVDQVVSHIVGLPQFVAFDDAAVHCVADALVAVVLVAERGLPDFFLRERLSYVQMDVSLGLVQCELKDVGSRHLMGIWRACLKMKPTQ